MRRITTLAFSAALLASTGGLSPIFAQAAPPASAPAAPPAAAPATPPAASEPAPAPAGDATTTPAGDTSSTPAKAPKTHHHAKASAKASPKDVHRGPATAGDAAVDDLNAKSLDAAKSGTNFTPPAPSKAEPAAKGAKSTKPAPHHHAKKPAAKPADAPAPDANTK